MQNLVRRSIQHGRAIWLWRDRSGRRRAAFTYLKHRGDHPIARIIGDDIIGWP